MTILNWFSILAIMVIIGLYTWVGYLWGKLDTQKKWLKDLKKINSKLKEVEEISEIERVFKKPISEVEEIEIPTFIRNREFDEEMKIIEALERKAEEIGNELEN